MYFDGTSNGTVEIANPGEAVEENMNFGEGIISKIYSWVWHPSNDDSTITDWSLGLVAILVLAFLWSTVVKMIE